MIFYNFEHEMSDRVHSAFYVLQPFSFRPLFASILILFILFYGVCVCVQKRNENTHTHTIFLIVVIVVVVFVVIIVCPLNR